MSEDTRPDNEEATESKPETSEAEHPEESSQSAAETEESEAKGSWAGIPEGRTSNPMNRR